MGWFRLARLLCCLSCPSAWADGQDLAMNSTAQGRRCLFSGQDEITPHTSSIYCLYGQGKHKCLSHHFIYWLFSVSWVSLLLILFLALVCESLCGAGVRVFRRLKKISCCQQVMLQTCSDKAGCIFTVGESEGFINLHALKGTGPLPWAPARGEQLNCDFPGSWL